MIEIESLEYKYEDGTKALNNINLNLENGNVIGIIGANGSGKSTLLLNIIGILKPNKGQIKYKNHPIKYNKKFLREYRQKVNIVFQDPDRQLFYSNVYDDIAFTLRNLGFSEAEIEKRAEYALKKVDAYAFRDKPTHFLSYGQKKRIAIAGVLAMDLELILFDEPTSGLDPYMTNEIKNIIKTLSKESKILISSHDMDLIYDICDYVYILKGGEILGEGVPEEIFLKGELLEKAYLEKPWLVKIHEGLGLPLYKSEAELFKDYGERRKK
ncbi:MAG: ATP-binding cassette domain-containing protein [Tissierellia bacterium]|nr:ATP-binding cassette domain-containing protein [Tissierellia bacterium]